MTLTHDGLRRLVVVRWSRASRVVHPIILHESHFCAAPCARRCSLAKTKDPENYDFPTPVGCVLVEEAQRRALLSLSSRFNALRASGARRAQRAPWTARLPDGVVCSAHGLDRRGRLGLVKILCGNPKPCTARSPRHQRRHGPSPKPDAAR